MAPRSSLFDSLADLRRSLRYSSQARRTALLIVSFTLLLLWSYLPTLLDMARRWSDDPKYSHGFLVPVFAAVVLWMRRPEYPGVQLKFSLLGLPWLLGAGLMRLVSAAFYLEWLDALSLLPAIAGLCVLLGGMPTLRWAWPGVVFLVFMMPAPYTLETALAQPLQRVAAASSTYLLQTFGLPAVAEGNVILIDEVKLGVVEACSGLGMLITFFALSTAFALLPGMRTLDRVVLFFSAVPIAVAANVARITLTGVLYVVAGGETARFVYHDLAGWIMMPPALLLLRLEMTFLSRLIVEPSAPPPQPRTPKPLEKTARSEPSPPVIEVR